MPLLSTFSGMSARAFGLLSKIKVSIALVPSTSPGSIALGPVSGQIVYNLGKVSITGAKTWGRNFNGGISQIVAVDSSENVYTSVPYGAVGPATAKYNSSGVIQWQNYYTVATVGNYNSSYAIMTADASGNLYHADSYINASSQGLTMLSKTTTAGAVSWARNWYVALGTAFTNYVYDIRADSSGNVFYAAAALNGSSLPGAVIGKISSTGTSTWAKSINTAGTAMGVVGIDGVSVVFAGGEGNYVSMVIKTDTNGTITWQRKITLPTTSNSPNQIYVDASSNYYVLLPYTLLKYNSAGTLLWARDTTNFYMYSMIVSGTDVYVLGTLTSAPSSRAILRFAADGSGTGGFSVNGSAFTYLPSTAVDIAGSWTLGTVTPSLTTGTYTATASSFTDAPDSGTWSLVDY